MRKTKTKKKPDHLVRFGMGLFVIVLLMGVGILGYATWIIMTIEPILVIGLLAMVIIAYFIGWFFEGRAW